MKIVAIDPGPKQSAFVCWQGSRVESKGICHNDIMIDILDEFRDSCWDNLVVEQVRSYGMPVGATVFDTVFWSGRFCQLWHGNFYQVPRLKVKQHLCHDSRAKDSNIIQALVDRFAVGEKNRGKGTKKTPGFFYGFKADIWQAFALAVTWYDKNMMEENK